jgi:hypothetical protein
MPCGRLSAGYAPRAVRGAQPRRWDSKLSTTQATRRPWTKPRTRQETRPLQIGSASPASAHPARLHPALPSGRCPCPTYAGVQGLKESLPALLALCLTSTRADCTNLLSPPSPCDPTRAPDAWVVIATVVVFLLFLLLQFYQCQCPAISNVSLSSSVRLKVSCFSSRVA